MTQKQVIRRAKSFWNVMRWFIKRLYRERRRLVVVAVLTSLCGYVAFFNMTGVILGLPVAVVASLSCMLVLTAFRRPKNLRSFAASNLPIEKLWPYLTVSPDTFADFGSKDTISMEWIEPGVSFRQIERSGELARIEIIHTIEALEPNQRYRFAFEVPDATETSSLSRGSYECWITQNGSRTKVKSVREFDRMSIRAQLFTWIDDAFGRADDEILRRAEAACDS